MDESWDTVEFLPFIPMLSCNDNAEKVTDKDRWDKQNIANPEVTDTAC